MYLLTHHWLGGSDVRIGLVVSQDSTLPLVFGVKIDGSMLQEGKSGCNICRVQIYA